VSNLKWFASLEKHPRGIRPSHYLCAVCGKGFLGDKQIGRLPGPRRKTSICDRCFRGMA